MSKFIDEDDVKKFLDKQMKYAEREQKKIGSCGERGDAYWQGQIDAINDVAEEWNLVPLWC